MRISDWSSDVCSSDLIERIIGRRQRRFGDFIGSETAIADALVIGRKGAGKLGRHLEVDPPADRVAARAHQVVASDHIVGIRSEEHTSELQSLMRISYAVFCLKKKIYSQTNINTITQQL